MIRFWYEADAIQIDGLISAPPRSLKAVLDGDRVHVFTLSDFRLSQSVYGEYARKDGTGFASAALAKAYLDGEFAKAPSAAAPNWDAVTGKPATFPPSAHTHPIADVSGLQPALDGKQPAGSYAPLSHVSDTNNPHATTKAQVGLGNVDNTADTAKPVSTATATALGGKSNVGHTHTIADVTGLQAALDGKLGAAVTPSTPARAIGTAFQPSTAKPVLASYAVKAQVTNPLLAGTSTTTVRLLSDAANPPTTVRDVVEASSGVGLSVTIQITTSNTAALRYLVPPGHFVLLQQAIVGTGTASIVAQTEEAIG
jgi:hypothetical protein